MILFPLIAIVRCMKSSFKKGLGRSIPVHTILAWFPGRPAVLLHRVIHYISSIEPGNCLLILCMQVSYFQIFQ